MPDYEVIVRDLCAFLESVTPSVCVALLARIYSSLEGSIFRDSS